MCYNHHFECCSVGWCVVEIGSHNNIQRFRNISCPIHFILLSLSFPLFVCYSILFNRFCSPGNVREANMLLQHGLQVIPPLLAHIPALLTYRAPIPQYLVRLISDLLTINPTVSAAVVQSLLSTGCLENLVQLLKRNPSEESEEMSGMVIDSQLIVLLRNIFESPDGAAPLLYHDLCNALVATLISSVYEGMNDTVSRVGMLATPSTANTSSLPNQAALGMGVGMGMVNQHELVIVLVDLVHVVLHFVIRALSTADEKDRQHNATHHTTSAIYNTQAELYRKQAAPLRALSPALLLIFAFVHNYLHTGQQQEDTDSQDPSSMLAYMHLLDSTSRCVGILYDLFPEAVSLQLLAKQNILLEKSTATTAVGDHHRRGGGGGGAIVTPRMVFSALLVNPEVEHLKQ